MKNSIRLPSSMSQDEYNVWVKTHTKIDSNDQDIVVRCWIDRNTYGDLDIINIQDVNGKIYVHVEKRLLV